MVRMGDTEIMNRKCTSCGASGVSPFSDTGYGLVRGGSDNPIFYIRFNAEVRDHLCVYCLAMLIHFGLWRDSLCVEKNLMD